MQNWSNTMSLPKLGALSGLGPCPGWGPYGPLWAHIWAHMGPYGPLWAHIWAHMGPYGPIYGPMWAHMGPCGPMWAHMGPPGQVLEKASTFRKTIWTNLVRLGSKTHFLMKFLNDSASFLLEKLKNHVILTKNPDI